MRQGLASLLACRWRSARARHQCSLCHVLHARRETDPGVHAVFVDGERGDRKAWISEGANRYSDVLLVVAFDGIVNRCTTLGAEAEGDLASFVADSNVLARLTADRDCASRESCLGAEDTSGSALTCKAMTDRNSNWLGSSCER
jgi:hypothetical protein